MFSEEQKRLNLMLSYKVCELYVKSGASSSSISEVTTIPLPTVKRSLQTFQRERDAYLRLFNGSITEEELDLLQEQIDEVKSSNKRLNKWRNDKIDFSPYQENVDEIQALYKFSRTNVSEDTKLQIKNFRMHGSSFREIAQMTGVSLSHVHKIATEDIDKPKSK